MEIKRRLLTTGAALLLTTLAFGAGQGAGQSQKSSKPMESSVSSAPHGAMVMGRTTKAQRQAAAARNAARRAEAAQKKLAAAQPEGGTRK